MRKKITTLILAAVLTGSLCMTSFAGQWQQAGTDWKYEQDGGYATGWQWIDGKSYYFDENGIMAKSTVIDGYELNADGQWIVNGVVQTQENKTENKGVVHGENYDPAHPLAGKIDEWNLRLPAKYIGEFQIVNSNVQALLTNQMDQYYMPPVGYSTSAMGNQVYTSQEAVDRATREEQALYDWFCNWLNSMNFESMSEMEKAKEIQKVLAQGINITGAESNTRNSYCSVLIDKQGMCAEYAVTAMSLAKALGLKAAVSGTGNHAVYYIQIDGKAYFGQNNVLNLNVPTPDFVAFD